MSAELPPRQQADVRRSQAFRKSVQNQSHIAESWDSERRQTQRIAIIPPFDAIRCAADGKDRLIWMFIAHSDEPIKHGGGVIQNEILHLNPGRQLALFRKVV
jgi:hypothetical protein